jgi:membrane-associated HD superfamily phosphohydrolase
VREGLELADSVGLPATIRAFIAEHHGTNTIAYFLERARERDGVVPNPSEFTYPGPVPQSAETAVVMLADGAEAAARALGTPTPERVREVIDRMVSDRLEQGQLRDAPLTLRQITLVKREFARVLGGMYHARVEYPAPASHTVNA